MVYKQRISILKVASCHRPCMGQRKVTVFVHSRAAPAFRCLCWPTGNLTCTHIMRRCCCIVVLPWWRRCLLGLLCAPLLRLNKLRRQGNAGVQQSLQATLNI